MASRQLADIEVNGRPLLDGKLLQGNETVVTQQAFEIEQDKLVVIITSAMAELSLADIDVKAEL